MAFVAGAEARDVLGCRLLSGLPVALDQRVREVALQPGEFPAVPFEPRLARPPGTQVLAPHDETCDFALQRVSRRSPPAADQQVAEVTNGSCVHRLSCDAETKARFVANAP